MPKHIAIITIATITLVVLAGALAYQQLVPTKEAGAPEAEQEMGNREPGIKIENIVIYLLIYKVLERIAKKMGYLKLKEYSKKQIYTFSASIAALWLLVTGLLLFYEPLKLLVQSPYWTWPTESILGAVFYLTLIVVILPLTGFWFLVGRFIDPAYYMYLRLRGKSLPPEAMNPQMEYDLSIRYVISLIAVLIASLI